MPTTIVMVRHSETDWNRENRFQGHADPPLNEPGRAQARELAAQLGTDWVTALYTSPLHRAHETARILAARLGLDVQFSDALKEVDVGSWSGLTRAEVEARFPDGFRRWLAWRHGWEDGESYDELGARVVNGLLAIAASHPDERVLAVTHGGPIRSTLAAAAGVDFDEARRSIGPIGNCTLFHFAIRNGAVERVH